MSAADTGPSHDRSFRCADAARSRADPLTGSAPPARRWLLLQHAGPWRVDAVAGAGLEPAILTTLTAAAARAGARILLIRRSGRSRPGTTRSWILAGLDAKTQSGTWADDRDLLIAADLLSRPAVPATEPQPSLLLICSHGVHDTCCAVRGRPVAAALAERWPDLVWECSHVGGDRFAPNLVVLPDGFYYGNLDPGSAVDTVAAHLGGTVPTSFLRGMVGFAPPVQAAAVAAYERMGPLPPHGVRLLAADRIGPHDGHGSQTMVELRLADRAQRIRVLVTAIRRPDALLTCRAGRPTPATAYEITAFDVVKSTLS